MKKINFNFKFNLKIGIFTFTSLFFLYLLYLSIPSLYDSGRVQKDLYNKLIKEFGLNLRVFDARKKLPFKDKEFDLVISINTLHNFKIHDLKTSLSECERVGKKKYLVVEGYRNEDELFNLQCWALTCESFFSEDEWKWIFDQFGYTGDYEFIYF